MYCLAQRTWNNIPVQLRSCPAQTQLVAEQSYNGCETMQHNAELQGELSSISSLTGVPGTESYPKQHSLLHPRACSGSEGLEGAGVAAVLVDVARCRSSMGNVDTALCSEDKQRAEISGVVNLSPFPSTELIF